MNDYIQFLPLIRENYSLRIKAHEYLRTSENLVVKLLSEDDTPYALRIRRIVGDYDKQVASELQFLHDFQEKTDVEVPAPVMTREGGLSCCERLDGEDYLCILFTWVPGEHIVSRDATCLHIEQMAASVARLHSFAHNYKPTLSFDRPVSDENLYFGLTSWSANPDFIRRLAPDDAEFLLKSNKTIRAFLHQYPKDINTFGMIHYDLHVGNFLFTDSAANMIDFDECGFGYYLFDLAHILFEFVNHPQYADFRQCALARYSDELQVADVFREHFDMFLALQGVAYVNWMNRLLTRDGNADAMKYWIPIVIRRLRQVMSSVPAGHIDYSA